MLGDIIFLIFVGIFIFDEILILHILACFGFQY